jgi:hypothetical protein
MSTNVPITVAHGDGISLRSWTPRSTSSKNTVALLGRGLEQGLEIAKTQTLRTYNGVVGYSLTQGQ